MGDITLEVREPRTHVSGHVEYEVVCSVLELLPGQPSSLVIRWSSYRRFSEFVNLDYALRKSFGSALDGAELPPKQWFGTGEPEFIMSRCRALHGYLQCMQRRCHGVTKFDTHLGSPQLAAFLRWEERIKLAPLPEAVKAAAGFGKAKEETPPEVGGNVNEDGSAVTGDAPPVTGISAGNMVKRKPPSQTAAARLASRKAILVSNAMPVSQTLAVDSAALSAYVGSASSPSSGFNVGDASSSNRSIGYSSSSASGSLALMDSPSTVQKKAVAGGGVTYNPPVAPTPKASPLPAATVSSPTAGRAPPPPTATIPSSTASGGPGKPPPPPADVPPEVAKPDAGRASLLSGITDFSSAKLKKAVTVDKSAPKL